MKTTYNVLFITIDALRADYCSFINSKLKSVTPNLNKLSRESIVYTNTFSTAPGTPYSFFSIFTGEYPSMAYPYVFPKIDWYVLLPQRFKNKGYITIGIQFESLPNCL